VVTSSLKGDLDPAIQKAYTQEQNRLNKALTGLDDAHSKVNSDPKYNPSDFWADYSDIMKKAGFSAVAIGEALEDQSGDVKTGLLGGFTKGSSKEKAEAFGVTLQETSGQPVEVTEESMPDGRTKYVFNVNGVPTQETYGDLEGKDKLRVFDYSEGGTAVRPEGAITPRTGVASEVADMFKTEAPTETVDYEINVTPEGGYQRGVAYKTSDGKVYYYWADGNLHTKKES
jgi:hypothetical protein